MNLIKTNISLFLFAPLLFISCSKKKIETDLSKEGVQKPATSITYNYYGVENSFGNLNKIPLNGRTDYPMIQCSYDDKGNLLDKSYYNNTGAMVRKEVFDRDNSGLLINWHDETRYGLESLGGEEYHTFKSEAYAYNTEGKVIHKITNDEVNATGVTKEIIDYQYDSSTNSVQENVESDYESTKNVADSPRFMEPSISQPKVEKFIRRSFYSEDGKDVKFIMYDQNARITLIDTSIYEDNYYESKTIYGEFKGTGTYYKYDKYGNVIEDGNISDNGTKIPYDYIQYDYDQYGSWIKSIRSDKDKIATKVIERIITYK